MTIEDVKVVLVEAIYVIFRKIPGRSDFMSKVVSKYQSDNFDDFEDLINKKGYVPYEKRIVEIVEVERARCVNYIKTSAEMFEEPNGRGLFTE